ncbi:MAG TPA: valine--tRNA ligase [bacterium]|nr:valine--tRNA ligase [bacterium]
MTEIPSAYEPKRVEERWYAEWLGRGEFHAVPDPARRPYTIVMPLPNVTGELHLGHALNNGLQDCLIRWSRMRGLNAMWQPGLDHASIAVHVVMDRRLAARGLTRFALGRERFLEETWKWKEQIGETILGQLRRLGCACDWDRTVFTMDPGYADAVLDCFVRLFAKGLIYKGKRMISWCPKDQTSIADLEVEYVETPSTLYYFRYPGEDGGEGVVIATQRPETILADVAVAVHPDDERYRRLVGTRVRVPLVNRVIPVIADRRVEREFGTGAVKITPGHDPLDNEIGADHKLPVLICLDPQGRINDLGGERYQGMDRDECRRVFAEDLRAAGSVVREEPYTTSIGRCDRCKTVIEPYISDQWFCRMQELAAPAAQAVRDGRVRFHPERWTKVYMDWMERIHDWNISRQLWWGQRIPIWYCGCGEVVATKTPPARCPKCAGTSLTQDPDVLDTWFSSALWPLATLGWPRETADLGYFYPTSTLVTARDIIFLWVARMIMFGLELRGEVPFRDVYINPTVLNIEGKRMSKTMGTGLDPLLLVDRYGADSLRFALINRCSGEQDLRFSEQMVESTRNFANKIWNAARFVRMHLDEGPGSLELPARASLALTDRWILSRFARTAVAVTGSLERFEFREVCQHLYEFIWNEFCDWYVEMAKHDLREPPAADHPRVTRAVLSRTLSGTMQLLHPIMPSLTEEIWQALPHEGATIMRAPWPTDLEMWIDPEAEDQLGLVMNLIRAVRGMRADAGVPAGDSVPLTVFAPTSRRPLLDAAARYIGPLARARPLTMRRDPAPRPTRGLSVLVGDVEVGLSIEAGEAAQAMRARLAKQLAAVTRDLTGLEDRLRSPMFLERAPAEIVEADRLRQRELTARRATLEQYLAGIGE